jgi:hypothetical protein
MKQTDTISLMLFMHFVQEVHGTEIHEHADVTKLRQFKALHLEVTRPPV